MGRDGKGRDSTIMIGCDSAVMIGCDSAGSTSAAHLDPSGIVVERRRREVTPLGWNACHSRAGELRLDSILGQAGPIHNAILRHG